MLEYYLITLSGFTITITGCIYRSFTLCTFHILIGSLGISFKVSSMDSLRAARWIIRKLPLIV